MEEQEIVLSLAKQKKELKFVFNKNLPESNAIAVPLQKVAARLIALGRKDFADRHLSDTATHLLKKPGKLLRPSLILAGAIALKQDPMDFVDLAVAGELLHIASLVHDDIIDRDSTRRGVPTVHAKYGEEAAILAGDAIIAKAVQISAKFGESVMEEMAEAAIGMCAGELLDFKYQNEKLVPDLKTYVKIARLKSADEIGTSCAVVAIHLKSKKAKAMQELGRNLGIAFQMRDDIMETLDKNDRLKNGGTEEIDKFEVNVVKVFEQRLGKTRQEALTGAVDLNNHFIDLALEQAKSLAIEGELLRYIDFVRIRSE